MSGNLKKAILENRLKRNSLTEIKTRLSFLQNINGWRKSKLHLLLGTTSSGKSTLMRSIIFDILENNDVPKIVLFLSEETSDDYELELFRATGNVDFKNRVKIFSEQDTTYGNTDILKQAFESEGDVLIYDNITTSGLYGEKFDEQSQFAKKLKHAAQATNKALIVVAHTNNVHKNGRDLIDSGHTRGSKTIVNLSEFLFINHQIISSGNAFNFIQIEKHRSQTPEDKIFRLSYDHKKSIYGTDVAVTFSDFKEMWKIRDKLL